MRDRPSITRLGSTDGEIAFVWSLLQQPKLAWANSSPNWASMMLNHPQAIAFAAKCADRHVGFFLAHPTLQRHAYECHAAFEPGLRRFSLAFARMAVAEFWRLAPASATRVYAYTPAIYEGANAMARAAGFRLVGNIADWFPMANGLSLAVNIHAIDRKDAQP